MGYDNFSEVGILKASLFLAASLFGAFVPFSSSRAEASPQFSVNAASPGAIQFAGSGTAQFNNSIGTNNSFQVGSSTNLGVNASTSSTPEYGVSSKANLSLAGTSTLKQVLGTSGSANDGGQISGDFSTVERGSAETRGNMADLASSARASAEAKYGVDYERHGGNFQYDNERDWQEDYDYEYNRAYGAAAAGATRESYSDVTVYGIGSDAAVTASDKSVFSVEITSNSGTGAGSTATANGSAGSSGTSSFANQSQSSTASGFMQAFGGQTTGSVVPDWHYICNADLCPVSGNEDENGNPIPLK